MFARYVEFEIVTVQLDSFITALRKGADESVEQEAGCQLLDMCQDRQLPSSLFLYENYNAELALTAHKQATHLEAFNHVSDGVLAHQPVRLLKLSSQH